jgi:hypothetical protein
MLSKSGLKLVSNVNIVYGNLNSENSQDYAQKLQRNCKFMNLASAFREVSVLLLIQYKPTGNRMCAGGGGGEVQMYARPRQYICKAKNSSEPLVIKEFHTKEGASEEPDMVLSSC